MSNQIPPPPLSEDQMGRFNSFFFPLLCIYTESADSHLLVLIIQSNSEDVNNLLVFNSLRLSGF